MQQRPATLILSSRGSAYLVLLSGRASPPSLALGPSGAKIGRDRDCDVMIADDRVSRRHCEILYQSGSWWLRDLSSVNGTGLNSRELRGGIAPLKFGDVLRIGNARLRFTATNGNAIGEVEADAAMPTKIFHSQPAESAAPHGFIERVAKRLEYGEYTAKLRDLVNEEGTRRADRRLRIEAVHQLAHKLAAADILCIPDLLSMKKSPGFDASVTLRPRRVTDEVRTSTPAPAKSQPRETSVHVAPRPPQFDQKTWDDVSRSANQLRAVLHELKVSVQELRAADAQIGPAVIRFRVKVPASTKIAQLQSRAADIGRALAAPQPPLIDNIPGENFVGIDIARATPTQLLLQPARRLRRTSRAALPFVVGVAPDGTETELDLSDLPHLLVAGSTGSGKTVFLQALLLQLVSNLSPSDVELIIIDPKETDFSMFRGLPHLHGADVVNDPKLAIERLQELVKRELVERTEILKNHGHRNLAEFLLDDRSSSEETRLRPMVVMIDEFADLLMQLEKKNRKAFENDVCRLAQRARSVGIHLVLATQRPSVDVITGLIKSNMPCRIAFRVPQLIDSRTILDRSGAENLLGRGDMLLLRNDRLHRLQGYNVPGDLLRATLKRSAVG